MAYFNLYTDVQGQTRFTLKGNNHEPVAQSEGYTSKQSAMHAIDVIKREAANAPTYDNTRNLVNALLGAQY